MNSVEVAGLILQSLADAPGSARLADLARATGMPSGKVHRYLVSLIRSGLVEQDPGTSRYDLGPLVLRAGVVALSRSDALKRAERMLEAIVARTGETAAAAVWGSHGPTLVRLVEARHELATRVPLGHVCPLTFSAVGHVYCAFGDPVRVAPLAAREMAQSRAAGRAGVPTHQAELDAIVRNVRDQGVAMIGGEAEGGLAAIAAPVFESGSTRMRLALVVFGRVGQLNANPDSPVCAFMLQAARSLTAELHGRSGA